MKGKVVLITGAGSGFGAETAVHFASKGCQLALVDKGPMEDTLDKCVRAGLAKEQILLILADLTVLDELKEVPEKTVKYFGRLDVLVNNAGIGKLGTLLSVTEETYDQTLDINCKAVIFLSQFAAPHLAKTRGNIVNISSIYGIRPHVGLIAYSASKAAVNQITQCAALELAPQKIRVNAVNPGHSKTNILEASGLDEDVKRQFWDNVLEQYPLGRLAEKTDIAKAIAFLADDDQAAFITGVCLLVDGGFHLGNCRK